MTRYPDKNPNLTDEEVDDWFLRVQGIHPEQIAEDQYEAEQDARRDALRAKHFPHSVEADLERVSAAFDEDREDWDHAGQRFVGWVARFEAWLFETFGPPNDSWEWRAVQGLPVEGEWIREGSTYSFRDPGKAAFLALKYGEQGE